MSQLPNISIVMPAYNEAACIRHTVSEIVSLLSAHCHLEILLVDDGSSDDTYLVAHELTKEFDCLIYLRLSRNFGKEAAISAGLHRAQGDAVMIVDADGQHPAEVLLVFMRLWREGYEVAYGVQEKRHESWLIKFAKKIYYDLMLKFSSIKIPANAGDFRLLDRKVVNSLNLLTENNRYMKGLYAWVGYRAIPVPYTANKRHAGHTQFDFIRLVKLGLSGLTGFSVLPLRLATILGFVVSALAFFLGIELVIEHFVSHDPLPGWPTLAVGMMFFAGIELLALGIIGEYVGNIFEEVKRRPLYLIAEESGQHQQKKSNAHINSPLKEPCP